MCVYIYISPSLYLHLYTERKTPRWKVVVMWRMYAYHICVYIYVYIVHDMYIYISTSTSRGIEFFPSMTPQNMISWRWSDFKGHFVWAAWRTEFKDVHGVVVGSSQEETLLSWCSIHQNVCHKVINVTGEWFARVGETISREMIQAVNMTIGDHQKRRDMDRIPRSKSWSLIMYYSKWSEVEGGSK